MKNELRVFENMEFGRVRVEMIEGEPWFVGKDVAECLGYSKPANAIARHIDIEDTLKRGIVDSNGKTQQTTCINESGMYSLILSSKIDSAKKFKRWVTSEVLPSIRKHGTYGTPKMNRKDELALSILNGNPDAIKLKEYAELVKLESLNGTNLIMSCGQIVNKLKEHIPELTTTIFNDWLANKMGLGTYEIPFGEKRRVFQPNEKYFEFVSGKGYALTSNSETGNKVKCYYTSHMYKRIVEHHLESLEKYADENVEKGEF